MSTEDQFPEWDDLPEDIRQTLRASGYDEESYNRMRHSALWVIPWADLSEEIRQEFISHGVTAEDFEANRLERESVGFCASLESRVICTEDLMTVMAMGRLMNFNRQLSDHVEDFLDPEGTHVLEPVLVHRHILGKVAEPHMRAWIYLKFKDSDEPQKAILDMSMEHFNNCQTSGEFAAERGIDLQDHESEWERFVRDFWVAVEEGPQARLTLVTD